MAMSATLAGLRDHDNDGLYVAGVWAAGVEVIVSGAGKEGETKTRHQEKPRSNPKQTKPSNEEEDLKWSIGPWSDL